MIDGKWFFIHDGIISGRSGQFYNGEEHDIDILIFMVVGSDQFQKLFVDFPIGVFSGEQGRAQGSHDQVLGNKV